MPEFPAAQQLVQVPRPQALQIGPQQLNEQLDPRCSSGALVVYQADVPAAYSSMIFCKRTSPCLGVM